MKRVLILDGSIYTDIYRPADQFRRLCPDVPCDPVHLPSGEQVPDLTSYTHLILTGSEGSIMEPESWYEVEAETVRRAFHRGMPILGSCFGHQMLVRALDGPGHVRRSPTPSVGWIQVDVQGEDPLTADLPPRWNVFVCHFDEVVDPPAHWRVLASAERCGVHVIRHVQKPVWGIQAHPEIPPEQGRALILGFREKRPDLAPILDEALQSPVRDDHVARRLLQSFLDQEQE